MQLQPAMTLKMLKTTVLKQTILMMICLLQWVLWKSRKCQRLLQQTKALTLRMISQ